MSAPAWLFQRGVLWAIDFERGAPAHAGARVSVRFSEAGRDTLEPLSKAMEQSDPFEARQRFDTGRRCFVGWVNNSIVTYGWLTAGNEEVGELERTYRMRNGDAYIWDCATLPAWRGQGLYSALLGHINLTLAAEGIRRMWIGSNLENEASLRAFAHAGFVPVIEVVYARLMRLCGLWMVTRRGATPDLVASARRMLVAPHERVLGALAVGIRAGISPSPHPSPAGRRS